MLNSVAYLAEPRKFIFLDEDVPSPNSDEVILKIKASGVCSSEIPFYTGDAICSDKEFIKYAKYPVPLGHEVVGEVLEVGEKISKFKVGDNVTGITTAGSGFCEYYKEKEENLIKIPEKVFYEHALGEPLTCAINILRNTEPEIGDKIVIVGDGFMGLLLVNLFSRYPLECLILVGMSNKKLALGKSFGASHIVNINEVDPYDAIEDILKGQNADISIEIAGNMKALNLCAFSIKDRWGKIIIPSFYTKKEKFEIGGYLMRKAPQLRPVHPAFSKDKFDDLKRAMWALNEGIFRMDKLITHKFKLNNIGEAFEFSIKKDHDFIKSIIIND